MNHQLVDLGEPARGSLRDRLLLLRAQSMLEGLDDDGLLLLAEHGYTATYQDGDVITAEGEPPSAVYIVIQGEMVISRAGRELNVRKVGDAYGALPLLAREPATLAVARGTTRTLEFGGAAFESALTENYSLLRNTLRVIGASVLAARSSLPVDPTVPREIVEGVYYHEPRSFVERLLELRESPFGSMNLEALVDMARHMVEVRYPAGHLLWSAGDASTHSFHIDVGRVRCTAPDGSHVAVAHGFTIGVLDVWGTRKRVYEARTETPVIGFRIDFEAFLALLEVHPEVGLELLRGFAQQLLLGMKTR